MLSLEVPEDELVRRLLERGQTSGRSDDASEDVVKKRIVEYHNKTAPVADHYAKFGKLKKIKGEGTIDNIFDALSKEIDDLMGVRV